MSHLGRPLCTPLSCVYSLLSASTCICKFLTTCGLLAAVLASSSQATYRLWKSAQETIRYYINTELGAAAFIRICECKIEIIYFFLWSGFLFFFYALSVKGSPDPSSPLSCKCNCPSFSFSSPRPLGLPNAVSSLVAHSLTQPLNHCPLPIPISQSQTLIFSDLHSAKNLLIASCSRLGPL